MSDNNNNDQNNNGLFGNSSSDEKKVQERKEEMQLLTRFKNVVSSKLERMTTEMEENDQKVYKMGEHEKKILLEMQGMGLAEGMAAGVATFILLRRGPIWIGKYILNRRSGGGGSGAVKNAVSKNNPFHNASQNTMSSSPGNSGGYQLANPFGSTTSSNPNFPRSRNPVVRGVWFLFDATISLMMAANVSVQYTDLSRIRNDLQELPLAEGKSLVSDAFCQDLTHELQQIQQENSPAYQRLVQQYQTKQKSAENSGDFYSGNSSSSNDSKGISPLALYMEGITLFSQNCERRAYRQRELFQEQGEFGGGFNDNDENSSNSNDDFHSIPIPPPGIAKDAPRLVRRTTNLEEEEEGKDEYTVVYGNNTETSDHSSGSDYWRGS